MKPAKRKKCRNCGRLFEQYLTTMQSHFRERGIWLEGLDPHYEQYPEAEA